MPYRARHSSGRSEVESVTTANGLLSVTGGRYSTERMNG
jgi:hypothetical protein